MMQLEHLEIRILLKCAKGLLQKKFISQYYSRYTATERNEAIETLLEYELISAIQLPKSDVRKTPTLYQITNKGKKWIEEYEKNYPKI